MKTLTKLFILPLAALVLMSMQTRPKRIIFLGDSITAAAVGPDGFITKIQQRLTAEGTAAQYELIGKGVSGNKIYDLYFRLEKDVLEKKPDEVFIYIGVNDVWHKTSSGTGTDQGRFEQFYAAIIQKVQAGGAKVILCTPAVIGERKDNTNQQDGDLNLYSQIVEKLAEKYKCGFINLRKSFMDYEVTKNEKNTDKGILTGDRVHLNPAGNELVANLMYAQLIK